MSRSGSMQEITYPEDDHDGKGPYRWSSASAAAYKIYAAGEQAQAQVPEDRKSKLYFLRDELEGIQISAFLTEDVMLDEAALSSQRSITTIKLGGVNKTCRVIPTKADGDCGFHATSLSLQLLGNKELAAQMNRASFIDLVSSLAEKNDLDNELKVLIANIFKEDRTQGLADWKMRFKSSGYWLQEAHFNFLSYYFNLCFDFYCLDDDSNEFIQEPSYESIALGRGGDDQTTISLAHVSTRLRNKPDTSLNHFDAILVEPTEEQHELIETILASPMSSAALDVQSLRPEAVLPMVTQLAPKEESVGTHKNYKVLARQLKWELDELELLNGFFKRHGKFYYAVQRRLAAFKSHLHKVEGYEASAGRSEIIRNLQINEWLALESLFQKSQIDFEEAFDGSGLSLAEQKAFLKQCEKIALLFTTSGTQSRNDLLEEIVETEFSKVLSRIAAEPLGASETAPSCFISYAWGHKPSEERVHQLALDLKRAGIELIIDVLHNRSGSIPRFTEKILHTDYVLVIGTPELKAKWEEQIGYVVPEELDLIAYRKRCRGEQHGVIRILLAGTIGSSFPDFMHSLTSLINLELSNHVKDEYLRLLSFLYEPKEGSTESPRLYKVQQEIESWSKTLEKLSHLSEAELESKLEQTQSVCLKQPNKEALSERALAVHYQQEVEEMTAGSDHFHCSLFANNSLQKIPRTSQKLGIQRLIQPVEGATFDALHIRTIAKRKIEAFYNKRSIPHPFREISIPIAQLYTRLSLIRENCEYGNGIEAGTVASFASKTMKLSFKEEYLFAWLPEEAELSKIKIVQRVLIRGQAGMGKTTFCYHYAQILLASGEWAFVIPLRKLLELGGNFDENQIWQIVLSEDLASADLTEIEIAEVQKLNNDNHTIYYFLDGYDEVADILERPEGKKLKQWLQKIIQKQRVVLTSRPSVAIRGFEADRHLEVSGFDEIQIKQYINKFYAIQGTPEFTEKLQSILNKNSSLKQLVQTPFILNLLVSIGPDKLTAYLPASVGAHSVENESYTQTQIYEIFLFHHVQKYLKRKEAIEGKAILGLRVEQCSSRILWRSVEPIISTLEKLAYEHFTKEEGSRTQFRVDDIDDPVLTQIVCNEFGLLLIAERSMEQMYRVYAFPHLSFQEYFTARYWVNNYLSEDVRKKRDAIKLFQLNKYEPSYELVWVFSAGILRAKAAEKLNDFFELVDSSPKDLIGLRHARLLIALVGESGYVNKKLEDVYRLVSDSKFRFSETMIDLYLEMLGSRYPFLALKLNDKFIVRAEKPKFKWIQDVIHSLIFVKIGALSADLIKEHQGAFRTIKNKGVQILLSEIFPENIFDRIFLGRNEERDVSHRNNDSLSTQAVPAGRYGLASVIPVGDELLGTPTREATATIAAQSEAAVVDLPQGEYTVIPDDFEKLWISLNVCFRKGLYTSCQKVIEALVKFKVPSNKQDYYWFALLPSISEGLGVEFLFELGFTHGFLQAAIKQLILDDGKQSLLVLEKISHYYIVTDHSIRKEGVESRDLVDKAGRDEARRIVIDRYLQGSSSWYPSMFESPGSQTPTAAELRAVRAARAARATQPAPPAPLITQEEQELLLYRRFLRPLIPRTITHVRIGSSTFSSRTLPPPSSP